MEDRVIINVNYESNQSNLCAPSHTSKIILSLLQHVALPPTVKLTRKPVETGTKCYMHL